LAFDDPVKLLAAAERMGLEGIVSKRRESVYRSGRSRDWIKVKTAAWRAANAGRGEMFEKKLAIVREPQEQARLPSVSRSWL
jgi:ATP-dependent DNA ligase